MIKTLTNVGNSKAIILPKKLIDKYNLITVSIHETENGILIRPASSAPTFQEKLEALKANKSEVYARIKQQASDPETIAYYENNDLSEIDLEIIEE